MVNTKVNQNCLRTIFEKTCLLMKNQNFVIKSIGKLIFNSRKISNCFYFFNINFIPISIFLKYSTFYISQYSDFSTNCEKNVNFIKHNNIETKNYVSEQI